jgi:hypothetical protein
MSSRSLLRIAPRPTGYRKGDQALVRPQPAALWLCHTCAMEGAGARTVAFLELDGVDGGRRLVLMATTKIEIDSELLDGLRSRHPGKPDQALIEDLARVELGFAALYDAQTRNAMSEEDAMALALEAVHETRRTA